ncbi:MAG TPA: hypothetical protein VHT96_05225 [Clostridia bacterium]|nr:hypothetical protein [Clostridia bacterium]
MGVKLLVLFTLLLLLCFSVYNWWFLKSRHGKQPLGKKKKSVFDSHVFWGVMSISILLVILGIMGSALYSLVVSVIRMQQGG